MTYPIDSNFIKALSCEPEKRTLQDLQIIYYGLHSLEPLSTYRDSVLRALSKLVRYEKHKVNDVLYHTGELSSCWYILLSGVIFIAGSMFLPGSSFGKRNGGNVRRSSECFVLETSEMIVIDYPELNHNVSNIGLNFLNFSSCGAAVFPYHSGITTSAVVNPQQQNLQKVSHNQETNQHININKNKSNNCSGVWEGGGIVSGNNSSGVRLLGGSAGAYSSILLKTRKMEHQLRQLSGINIVFEENNFPSAGRPELYQKCNRGSHSSDTSSAYSGSDTMTSVHSSSLDTDEVDLSGLVESVVDSDEEDLAESMDSLTVRDTVRECLEKDPSDRNEDDIEILLEFTQKLKAFTNMTLAVRRALCSVMVFAVVEKAGTMVMNDGEELDSWSVLINGHVEVEPVGGGDREELQVGDSFGILPTMDKLYHRGIMRTKCDDCQFVCITQTDYYRIQHQGEENIKRHEIDGRVVMVTELRHGTMEVGRKGHVVIRGSPERLMLQLIEENSISDPTYIEDFLLTHRTFIDNPNEVAGRLIDWFENFDELLPVATVSSSIDIRDRVTRVVLLWVENHFTDFETDTKMMEFLEKFEQLLEEKSMHDQLRLFHIKCSAKAKIRTITLARSSRDEPLNFQIVGGYDKGFLGIFIVSVEPHTKSEEVGLKRGDQVIEVNGQNFEHVTHKRAMELLTGTTHLCITVKNNLLGFREMLIQTSSDTNSTSSAASSSSSSTCRSNSRHYRQKKIVTISEQNLTARLSSVDIVTSQDQIDNAIIAASATPLKKDSLTGGQTTTTTASATTTKMSGFMTLVPKRRLQKALIRMNLLPKNSLLLDHLSGASVSSTTQSGVNGISSGAHSNSSAGINSGNDDDSIPLNQCGSGSVLYQSHSNPDLTSILYYDDPRSSDYPEHVLKVYKSDQTCKYLLVHKETTSHEVVMLALQEFGIHDPSSNFSLCEVSVGEGGMIKQRRLPEQLQNLAERIGLSSRYYLKTNGVTETLVPDDMAAELIRESLVHFLQLNANEIAIQLTLQDFAIFRQIESTEYIDDLFELDSRYGVPMLRKFSELVNREMFWVVTEVCREHNMVRRMKIVKQFIKVARHCKECKNFNSMFAIISGLGHVAVSRLRQTWEKLPTKYQKLFNDLQDLMDPSRNMSKYRQLVAAELQSQHPIIPFYPVVKKDLTFIHLGNDTKIEGLINFEKLRMISKEIRNLTHMCSTPHDLLTTLELRGQPPSSAMVALNQMSVSSISGSTISSTGNSGGSSGAILVSSGLGQTTVKRRKKSTAAPNPKKMFEEAQMVRRVKAYLNNIKIITDEDTLQQYSIECEPSGFNNSAPNSVTIRKRHPSPTLSTTSSTSSTSEGKKGGSLVGPKFGAASPQAVKKILSLSETNKTRPHQPRHPGIGLPLTVNLSQHHGIHQLHHTSSISPSPSPGAHRRMGSSSSAGAVPYTAAPHTFVHPNGRAVHERSHSDTPTPLPSVDLSAESSSVTSLSNLPHKKTITSAGSVTSSDSGHSSCIQTDTHSNCSEGGSSLYHVASSIVHNSPSPTLQQRRHSAMQVSTASNTSTSSVSSSRPPFPHAIAVLPPLPPHSAYVVQTPQYHSSRPNGHGLMAPPPSRITPRHPPAYSVAAQMARLHRLGRAHSHEGVTSTGSMPNYFHAGPDEDDDDDGAQVSAV